MGRAANEVGGLFAETTLIHYVFDEPQLVPNESREQRFGTNLRLPGAPEALGNVAMLQQEQEPGGTFVHAFHQVVFVPRRKLKRSAARPVRLGRVLISRAPQPLQVRILRG